MRAYLRYAEFEVVEIFKSSCSAFTHPTTNAMIPTRRSSRRNANNQRKDTASALKPKRLLGLGEKRGHQKYENLAAWRSLSLQTQNITSIVFTGLKANDVAQYVSEGDACMISSSVY
jgi:hypothetical protein